MFGSAFSLSTLVFLAIAAISTEMISYDVSPLIIRQSKQLSSVG